MMRQQNIWGFFNGFVYHEDAQIYVCSPLHIPGTVQIAGLRRRVEELKQAKELGVGTAQDFAKAIAVAADFLHQIEGIRKDAANQPRKQASAMFKASRQRTGEMLRCPPWSKTGALQIPDCCIYNLRNH